MNETKQKLTALFKRGWLNDEEINTLEHMDIGVKVYPIDDELEMRIDVSDLDDTQKSKLHEVLDDDIVDEIKNNNYTWLILYM